MPQYGRSGLVKNLPEWQWKTGAPKTLRETSCPPRGYWSLGKARLQKWQLSLLSPCRKSGWSREGEQQLQVQSFSSDGKLQAWDHNDAKKLGDQTPPPVRAKGQDPRGDRLLSWWHGCLYFSVSPFPFPSLWPSLLLLEKYNWVVGTPPLWGAQDLWMAIKVLWIAAEAGYWAIWMWLEFN